MKTYGFSVCAKCCGFGLVITIIERMQILSLMSSDDGMNELRTMQLSKDESRDICGSCKGTGWQLTESTKLKYNNMSMNTINR